MYKLLTFWGWIALVAAMAGCVSTKYIPVKGVKSFPPTTKLEIIKDYPNRQHVVLGVVAASGALEGKLLPMLKEKAMSIGADAIILRRPSLVSQEYTSEQRTQFKTTKVQLEAVAIKYLDAK